MCGIFHSKLTGGLSAVFGRLICTLCAGRLDIAAHVDEA